MDVHINSLQNVVLSDKPAITTTIPSLPPALLDSLIQELSTLASVYHKLPESFLGQGRFGAEAMQKAAIEYVSLIKQKAVSALIVSVGSKSNLRARTLLLRPQRQQQCLAAMVRRPATSRTYSISTSTVQRQHRCRTNRHLGLRGSRDWQAHHSAWRRQLRQGLDRPTTWTISWACLAAAERRRRAPVRVHPARTEQTMS